MNLHEYLLDTARAVEEAHARYAPFPYEPRELFDGAFSYFLRGGKRLRPAIARLSAGALGGEAAEKAALPLALGLEYYHNWTLIHDDMIDHDDFRRGKKAVHKTVRDGFLARYGAEKSAEYGADVALLAGDALHAAACAAVCRLSDGGAVKPEVTLRILSLLENEYGPRVITGEMIDTKFGFEKAFWERTEEEILTMIRGKTAALFEISALSGALVGQNDPADTPLSRALTDFAGACGVAFQLQDDLLGLTSTAERLGKPIGSDVREGKPTVILITAFQNATEEERAFLKKTVGSPCSENDFLRVKAILFDRGGADRSREICRNALEKAEKALEKLPASPQKELLGQWKSFMTDRDR